ncbi:PREDICTED: uncharacterized protein LOC108761530 isoform X2 [Trachymyrmex cornetzi]|nr:PREDICTED: uncharacterized protein LOC108761530 isoform X2 [Trachymyrmex cornetzi]
MGSEFDLTSETEMSLNEVWNSRRIFMDDQWNELVKETKGFKSDYKSKKEKPLKIVMCCRQFTVNQRNELMQVLRETRYPDRRKLMELAERMGVSFQKISMWFRNIRRTKPRNKKGQAKSSSTHKNQKIVSSEFECENKNKEPQSQKIVPRGKRFTVGQRDELIRILEETRYPGKIKMAEIAQKMGVSSPNISTWFRNNRRNQRNKQLMFSSTCDRQETVCPESVFKSGKKNPLKTTLRRKRFTANERKELIRVFEETPYPTRDKMEELALKMKASFHSITKWFQNSRTYNPYKHMPSSSYDHHENVNSDRRSETKIMWDSQKTFTDVQRSELVRVFEETPYPSKNKMEELAQRWGMPFYKITSWFARIRQFKRDKITPPLTRDDHDGTVHSNFNYRNGTIKLLKTNLSRKTFTDDERNELMQVFEKNPYLKRNKMEKLSLKMEVPFHSINVWFKNARRYNREKIDLLKGRIKIEHSYCKSEMKKTKPVKTASRRKRKLTDDQMNELALVLKETPYPRRNKMEELAQKMGMTFHNINLWLRKIRRTNLNKLKSSSSHDYHEKPNSGFD